MKLISLMPANDMLHGTVKLPASKSISNRALMIRAMCEEPFLIQNLSDADDTVLMESLFQSPEKELYVKNAGTTARFLLAYFASRPCDVVLKGSERMHDRPIGLLVTALLQMGADIEYLGKEGHLPVHIHGKELEGGFVSIPANVSSQFISSLLLISHGLKNGLTIELKDETVSRPYIDMTLGMMAAFGIKFQNKGNHIAIPPQKYQSKTFFVESDWSSASYFFALAALFPGSRLRFQNLFKDSLQGDSILTEILKLFGIDTFFEDRTCIINSKKAVLDYFEYDFIDHPDLIPTFVCLCCALNIPYAISGAKTLKYKESNRAEVLRAELEKVGYVLKVEDNILSYDGSQSQTKPGPIILNTYDDHRIAMSFAILASKNPDICISNPDVVEKSFPGFWEEIKNLAFELQTEHNGTEIK